MSVARPDSRFYLYMGILLLILVLIGFGSVAVLRGSNPLELPLPYHIHGGLYLVWFSLFILQVSLIGKQRFQLHKRLGYTSLVVVLGMLASAMIIVKLSYTRGTSPIPDISIQNFLAFPMIDVLGLILFYSLGVINRHKPLVHKHSMLMASIAIMDPAIARLALVIGVMPLALVIHIGLVGLVMWHDKRVASRVHFVTWLGLAYVVLRLVFVFSLGATQSWATLMDTLFS